MNNLDDEVAEKPGELVVYGGIGRAARDWDSYDRIVATLRRLREDQTLLVQSGKPVGVFETHADAPRVLIANSNLVPRWATWEHFSELDRKGLMMYGQMTAGSWIYIGSQGIVQGTYETFAECGRQHFGGDLAGRWILTGGLGGMGGAQPLAGVFAGASCWRSNASPPHREAAGDALPRPAGRRPRRRAGDDPSAPARSARPSASACSATRRRSSRNWSAAASCPTSSPTRPARTTRSTATCPPAGRWPSGRRSARATRPRSPPRRSAVMVAQVQAMLDFQARGAQVLDYGNNIRQMAKEEGLAERLRLPRLRPGLYPPAVLPRHRPVPLGGAVGRPGGHLPHRRQGEGADPRRRAPAPLARHGARAHRLPGPAGAHLLGRARRSATGSASPSTRWWRAARSAPIVIGRDHLDCGSVASPEPRDRGDAGRLRRRLRLAAAERAAEHRLAARPGSRCTMAAASAWASASTPAWSSSPTAREDAARRLERVLWNDPATGVMRHADAGYDIALDCAREHGLDLPMLGAQVTAIAARAERHPAGAARGSWRAAPLALPRTGAAPVEASAAALAARDGDRRGALWRQHRLRQAGQHPHPGRPAGAAAAATWCCSHAAGVGPPLPTTGGAAGPGAEGG